jgi:hypothetical protein
LALQLEEWRRVELDALKREKKALQKQEKLAELQTAQDKVYVSLRTDPVDAFTSVTCVFFLAFFPLPGIGRSWRVWKPP